MLPCHPVSPAITALMTTATFLLVVHKINPTLIQLLRQLQAWREACAWHHTALRPEYLQVPRFESTDPQALEFLSHYG
jgi:hypothetical protein